MKIGVTCDAAPDDECALVTRALARFGESIAFPADASLPSRLDDERPDIVVNLARGRGAPERRLHVPAFLEFFGIPYSGSDAVANATCLARPRLKAALASHGIPTAGFEVVSAPGQLAPLARRSFPVAIRRVRGVDSCFAPLVAHDFDELESIASELLAASAEPVLVERFLPGESFACCVVGNGAACAALPVVSVPNDPFAVVGASGATAARIDDGLAEDIEALAIRAFHALGCRDLARIDIRLSGTGVPNVCNVDPLPALADPREATTRAALQAAGVSEEELVQRFLLLAAERSEVSVPHAPTFARLPRRTPASSYRIRVASA